MAYTPINWAENSGVTAVKLDKMDNQIDANEQDLRNIENDFVNNEIIKKAYPVGSIYINANNGTNPATLLGFGTWERFGEGRVLVSQDSTDADFDAIGETGGEKEHQLTVDEMPSHNHSGTTSSNGSHEHGIKGNSSGNSGSNVVQGNANTTLNSQLNNTDSGGSHNHSFTTSTEGSDNDHNNLQPYITVYMWVRTA